MLGDANSQPSRYVIDFQSKEMAEAAEYKALFAEIKKHVLPDRVKKAEGEQERNEEATDVSKDADVNRHHANVLAHWWRLSYHREDLIQEISRLPRYIVCGRVTKRPIFEFIHPAIHPNDALTVFTLPDDYSFGILQSSLHWQWFNERCSTLKSDPRYTSNTVFDSFPWPQEPSRKQIAEVCEAAVALRLARRRIMRRHGLDLRNLYRLVELPGENPIKDVQDQLEEAVHAAYGLDPETANPLPFLLALNLKLSGRESRGEPIQGPGLPRGVKDPQGYISSDSVRLWP